MDLDFTRIECEISTETPVQLITALYEALRDFESQFKGTCCMDLQDTCYSCGLQSDCPYGIVFGQKLSSDPDIVRLHQKPSLPFSLYINGRDGNSASCTAGMVIIGSALNYIECFHTALLRMVESAVSTILSRAKFTLLTYSLDYQGIRHQITKNASIPGSVILLSGQYILENSVHSDCVNLKLKSPLRLISNGSIARRFDFGIFFRSQLRRCSSLCAYYGSGQLDLDFALLTESAQNIAVFDDKIRYTQPPWTRRLNMAGLTGEAECTGLIEPMFSLLQLGSYFNAGKGATFGSGFYQL